MSADAPARTFRIAGLVAALTAIITLVVVGWAAPAARADTSGAITSFSLSTDPASQPTVFSDASPASQFTAPTLSNSTTPAAESDANFSESLAFNYGSDNNYDETVNVLTLQLPVGLLAHLGAVASPCTAAQLASFDPTTTGAPLGDGCPAGAQIGSLTGDTTAYALGLSAPAPIGANLYLMAPTDPSDVADIGVEVYASVLGIGTDRALVASGPITYALVNGEPQLTVTLPLPSQAYLENAAGNPLLDLGATPYTLDDMVQTINGETTTGQPFGLMPGSDAPAATADAVTVQDNGKNNTASTPVAGLTGTGTATLTPTGATSLPYAPQVSASVSTESSDALVGLTTTITQAADEDPSSQITVTFPAFLEPNFANAVGAIEGCPTTSADLDTPATYANCTVVGTATASSPLLGSALTANVYLTGAPLSPVLVLVFPPPFSMVITGNVTVNNNDVVNFATVPDLPLTSLAVALTGGSGAVFMTTCTPSDNSAPITGAFTNQGGTASAGSSTVTVNGCPTATSSSANSLALVPTSVPSLPAVQIPTAVVPPTPATTTGTVTAKRGLGAVASFTGLVAKHPKPSLSLALADTAAKLNRVTITAPSGLKFVTSAKLAKDVKVTGATVKSVSLSHGKLIVTLKRASAAIKLKISSAALSETAALERSIARGKTKNLRTKVAVTTTGPAATVTVSARA